MDAKSLPSSERVITLDFSDIDKVPLDGDAGQIRKMLDDATTDAIRNVPSVYGASMYQLSMASDIASEKFVPVRVIVKSPVRRDIKSDMPLDEASRTIEGYVTCDRLWREFRDADERIRHDVLYGVIKNAIRVYVPTASDKSIDAILGYAKTLSTSPLVIINNVKSVSILASRLIKEADASKARKRTKTSQDGNADGSEREKDDVR